MPAAEYNEAETKKMIADAVQKGDVFRIRVMRRRANGMPEVIASFEEGRAEHLLYPEKWLPDLAGGGTYSLQGFHNSSPFESVGGSLLFNVENIAPRLVNPDTVQQGDWQGPLNLSYPRQGMRRPSSYAGATSIDGAGWTAAVDIDPRGGVTPLRSAVQNGGDLDALSRAQRAEQQLLEMRKQNEIDNLRRDHAAQMERMNQSVNQLRDELRSSRERDNRPHESLGEVLAKALAPLVPVVQAVVTGQNEMRVKMLDVQQQTTAQQIAAAREGNERLDKILTAMMQPKPPGIDPTVQLLVEHMKSSSTNPVLTDVINAFSGMSQATLSVMTAATDAGLLGQREEGGATGIIRELGAAAASFFSTMAERQGRVQRGAYPGAGAYRRLPAGPPPPQQPPPAIGQLDQMIKGHFDPAQTARFFLDSLGKDADLTERFAQQNNDIEAFFRSYWSGWAQQNLAVHGPYVSALHEAVMADAKARGWYVPPDPGHPPPQPQGPPAYTPPPPNTYNPNGARPERVMRATAPSPQGVILDDEPELEEDEEGPVDPGDEPDA
jgi:hypothetical protein